MPDYRFYPLNRAGTIDGAGQDFASIDDAAAIEVAYARHPEQPFEIWRGTRKVYVRKKAQPGC